MTIPTDSLVLLLVIQLMRSNHNTFWNRFLNSSKLVLQLEVIQCISELLCYCLTMFILRCLRINHPKNWDDMVHSLCMKGLTSRKAHFMYADLAFNIQTSSVHSIVQYYIVFPHWKTQVLYSKLSHLIGTWTRTVLPCCLTS